MNPRERLRAYDRLLKGGPGTSTLLACDLQDAKDVKAWLYENGIATEVDQAAPGTFRFTRKREEVPS